MGGEGVSNRHSGKHAIIWYRTTDKGEQQKAVGKGCVCVLLLVMWTALCVLVCSLNEFGGRVWNLLELYMIDKDVAAHSKL